MYRNPPRGAAIVACRLDFLVLGFCCYFYPNTKEEEARKTDCLWIKCLCLCCGYFKRTLIAIACDVYDRRSGIRLRLTYLP